MCSLSTTAIRNKEGEREEERRKKEGRRKIEGRDGAARNLGTSVLPSSLFNSQGS
jgi:hypothetical protein